MGNNANSIINKIEALEYILSADQPSAVFLQEKKLGRPG